MALAIIKTTRATIEKKLGPASVESLLDILWDSEASGDAGSGSLPLILLFLADFYSVPNSEVCRFGDAKAYANYHAYKTMHTDPKC